VNQRRGKGFSIQEQMNNPAQVDNNKETHVALAARLGTVLSTLKTIVKSRKDTNKFYAQCGRFSGHGEIVK
jgi:hypothetical protein